MRNYVGVRYEYCMLFIYMGVGEDFNAGPPSIMVLGETVESTNPVDALAELGQLGYNLQTTSAATVNADLVMFVNVLGRPIT